MTFFKIVFIALFIVAMINLFKVGVDWSLRSDVYACSEVGKGDPLNVRKKCYK